jgi:hypothetical protein
MLVASLSAFDAMGTPRAPAPSNLDRNNGAISDFKYSLAQFLQGFFPSFCFPNFMSKPVLEYPSA